MTDLDAQRKFFAEEIQIASNIRSAEVIDALASVPREQFLPPGPWLVRGENDFAGAPRHTPDADPRHVYHNVAIGIDPARMLFNGAPGLLGLAIDALALAPGERVLHLGAGTGYYSAVMAHCVGPSGHVTAVEVDEPLAARAAVNLHSMPWVDVEPGNGSRPFMAPFDAMLINAGVTHPLDTWLDALSPSGRLVLPLTATMPAMGNIGKGLLLLLTRTADPDRLDVRTLTIVAIFSAIGLRDEALNVEIGKVLMKQLFPRITRLRRDAHERSDTCLVHRPACCFSGP